MTLFLLTMGKIAVLWIIACLLLPVEAFLMYASRDVSERSWWGPIVGIGMLVAFFAIPIYWAAWGIRWVIKL